MTKQMVYELQTNLVDAFLDGCGIFCYLLRIKEVIAKFYSGILY